MTWEWSGANLLTLPKEKRKIRSRLQDDLKPDDKELSGLSATSGGSRYWQDMLPQDACTAVNDGNHRPTAICANTIAIKRRRPRHRIIHHSVQFLRIRACTLPVLSPTAMSGKQAWTSITVTGASKVNVAIVPAVDISTTRISFASVPTINNRSDGLEESAVMRPCPSHFHISFPLKRSHAAMV